MVTPARHLRRRTKLAVLLCLILPGTLADSFARAARQFPDERVTIGRSYRLNTKTGLSGTCEGCKDQALPAIPNAILTIGFVSDESSVATTLRISGDAAFVSPVTGRLTNPLVLPDGVPPPILAEAANRGCTELSPALLEYQLLHTGDP